LDLIFFHKAGAMDKRPRARAKLSVTCYEYRIFDTQNLY